MKVATYSLLVLFLLPLLILVIYLGMGIYSDMNILHLFTQDSFLFALKQSIILSSSSAMLSLAIGALLANAFYSLKPGKLRIFYLLILLILFMLQPIMILAVVKQVKFFTTLDPLSQSLTIAILHLMPLATLFWIALYRYMQTEALCIARHLVISQWSTYWHIVLPQIRYKIVLAFVGLFILVFIDQEVPSILGYRTYTEELLSQMTLMEEMKSIVSSALPSFLLVGVLGLGIIWGFKQASLALSDTLSQTHQKSTIFGKIIFVILSLWLGAILFILLRASSHLSIETLVEDNIEVILQTLSLTLSVSCCTLLLALFFHDLFQKYTSYAMRIVWFFALLCYLLLPHSLISLALLTIYQKIGIFSSIGDFIVFFLGYVFVLLPIAFLLLFLFSMQKKKDDFLDFFSVSTYQRWLRIILPQQWAVWTIVFFILMTFALNELSVSILLVPPGFETMIVKIYNLLHYGDKANIAFLSWVQLLFIIGCFAILSFLTKKVLR